MKEIISLNIGQCGVQKSNAIWELLCVEHGINADGKRKEISTNGENKAFETFFSQSSQDLYVPRVITVDLEPTVVDEIRTGRYRQLFHPDTLISGDEDASSNFARGHLVKGKAMINGTMNQIRKVFDNCNQPEGFMLTSSYGGGSGSGFLSLILEHLSSEYSKTLKLSFVNIPSDKLSTSTVEPYNSVLACHLTSEQGDMSAFFDNKSIYDICFKSLDINRPTYSNLNRLIAQVYSSMTVSLRYESSLNSNLDQIITNLIPYPRIHYEMMSYSPIISVQRAIHDELSTVEITRNVFDVSSKLLDIDLTIGKYMSCCLQYCGDVTPREVNEAIFEIKKRSDIKFVDWCPTGFKIGISFQPPATIPESGVANLIRGVSMIANTSSIAQLFEKVNKKFNSLYNKKSFIHWFVGEGMEETEFDEAFNNIRYLIKDYKELEICSDDQLVDKAVQNVKVPNSERSEIEEVFESADIVF